MIDLASSVRTLWRTEVFRALPPLGTGCSGNARPGQARDGLAGSARREAGAGRVPASFQVLSRKAEERRPRVERSDSLQGNRERCADRPTRSGGGPARDQRLPTVRELPAEERPRERLAALGAQNLSAPELIACLLGRGISGESVLVTARRLLARFESLQGIAEASVEELSQVRGIGLAKACQLKAAVEIGRRAELYSGEESRGRPLETPEAAGRAARRWLAGRKKEHFILLLLDSRHRILRVAEISVGTLDMSVVHPRETFREAILASAAAIILAHNHPSGDPAPSREDLELTRRLTEAGRLLGIPVLDHLIVGAGQPLSLRSAGFLEETPQ